jgi:hypothetical protein
LIQLEGTGQEQVLDGQQRLAAIRDFAIGALQVAGDTQPPDQSIAQLDGLTFGELPPEWRRKFNRFTIRVIRITDYLPGEPGELFFRLNQPTNLTSAEHRNALFGPARHQVKELVEQLSKLGLGKDFLGFSNSRMSYDDVLARFCTTIEAGTLQEKITASVLANRYRAQEPFPDSIIKRCSATIHTLAEAKEDIHSPIKFNKATLYSWLIFISDYISGPPAFSPSLLGKFIYFFETFRELQTDSSAWQALPSLDMLPTLLFQLFAVYNDRSTARVADVSSVILRDAVLWIIFRKFIKHIAHTSAPKHYKLDKAAQILPSKLSSTGEFSIEEHLNSATALYHWGELQ